MKSATLAISQISIPEGRLRKVDYKKVEQLAKSIHSLGLLSPVIVSKNKKTLVAGAHRLHACEMLGYDEIDARVLESDTDIKLVEIDENLKRNDLKSAQKKEHMLLRVEEIMKRMRIEVYQEAIQDSIDNKNLSQKDAPEALEIVTSNKPIEHASNNKIKEAVNKALNLVEKRAIEIVEGEYQLTQRYIRDALRASKKAKVTFDAPVTRPDINEFKTHLNKRLNGFVKELESELTHYEDEQHEELSDILERLKQVMQ